MERKKNNRIALIFIFRMPSLSMNLLATINPIPLRFSTMTVSQGNMEVSKSLISTALKENQKMLDVISLQN